MIGECVDFVEGFVDKCRAKSDYLLCIHESFYIHRHILIPSPSNPSKHTQVPFIAEHFAYGWHRPASIRQFGPKVIFERFLGVIETRLILD